MASSEPGLAKGIRASTVPGRDMGIFELWKGEPAPEPGKGPESAAAVLTALGPWHLPAVEAIGLSIAEGKAPKAVCTRLRIVTEGEAPQIVPLAAEGHQPHTGVLKKGRPLLSKPKRS